MPQHQKYFSSLIRVSQIRVSSARTLRHVTLMALCTAVGLVSRLERIPFMSSTKQIIHAILIVFAFSTTLVAEHLVEIHVAHEDSKLVLCHPN